LNTLEENNPRVNEISEPMTQSNEPYEMTLKNESSTDIDSSYSLLDNIANPSYVLGYN